MRIHELFRSLDWLQLNCAMLLLLIGLSMLFSSTYTTPGFLLGRFGRQLIAIGLGLLMFGLFARLPYHVWQRYAWLVYGVGLIALAVVSISSQVIRGTISRFSFAGFQLQPSEFMKVALIIALAALLARFSPTTRRGFILSTLLIAIPTLLIILEPDIGTALLLITIWLGLLIFSGLSFRALLVLALLLGILGVASWHWFLLDYQKARFLVFLDPNRDPFGAGYNVFQSIVALGSGRLLGRGLGHGPQSQLQFLPEQHTDFILASIGEELGFIGVSVVLVLYGLLLWRLLIIARSTQDRFGQLLSIATFVLLLTSLTVSAGMNMGMLPVTGIPLPLVSYGGSNLVATLMLLGITQSVWLHRRWRQQAPPEISEIT